jgi:integrase
MGARLQPGEHGEIGAVPQRQDENGMWKTTQVRSAQRWRAYVRYCGHDGVVGTASGFGAKKAVALTNCRANLEDKLRTGGDSITPNTLLVDAGREWLRQIARPGSGRGERTVSDYTRSFERHISSSGSPIRGLTLRQVNDPQTIRRFLQTVADGRGTGSAKMCKSVLSGIVTYAVNNGVLKSNAVRQVEPIKAIGAKESRRDHTRAFTLAQRDWVIDFADQRAGEADLNPRTMAKRRQTADFVAFLAGTGVRIAEARALRWEDLSLGESRVHVRGTKTSHADRHINMPEWLTLRMKEKLGDGEPSGLVFPAPGTSCEREWEQSNNNAAVREVLDGAGFDWAISHTFRRTVASLLHERRLPIVEIADWLGHADPSMTTRIYLGRDFHGDKATAASYL